MPRRSLAIVGLAALALALATVATARPSATKKLQGTVGPGFTITLKKNGKRVKTLAPGRYTFVIKDRSSFHNFELEKVSGGEFEREFTDVSQTGTKTATVRLTKGRYKFYCKPHESQMKGFFTVR